MHSKTITSTCTRAIYTTTSQHLTHLHSRADFSEVPGERLRRKSCIDDVVCAEVVGQRDCEINYEVIATRHWLIQRHTERWLKSYKISLHHIVAIQSIHRIE